MRLKRVVDRRQHRRCRVYHTRSLNSWPGAQRLLSVALLVRGLTPSANFVVMRSLRASAQLLRSLLRVLLAHRIRPRKERAACVPVICGVVVRGFATKMTRAKPVGQVVSVLISSRVASQRGVVVIGQDGALRLVEVLRRPPPILLAREGLHVCLWTHACASNIGPQLVGGASAGSLGVSALRFHGSRFVLQLQVGRRHAGRARLHP